MRSETRRAHCCKRPWDRSDSYHVLSKNKTQTRDRNAWGPAAGRTRPRGPPVSSKSHTEGVSRHRPLCAKERIVCRRLCSQHTSAHGAHDTSRDGLTICSTSHSDSGALRRMAGLALQLDYLNAPGPRHRVRKRRDILGVCQLQPAVQLRLGVNDSLTWHCRHATSSGSTSQLHHDHTDSAVGGDRAHQVTSRLSASRA